MKWKEPRTGREEAQTQGSLTSALCDLGQLTSPGPPHICQVHMPSPSRWPAHPEITSIKVPSKQPRAREPLVGKLAPVIKLAQRSKG